VGYGIGASGVLDPQSVPAAAAAASLQYKWYCYITWPTPAGLSGLPLELPHVTEALAAVPL